MSKLTERFLSFLLEKRQQADQNSFTYLEYKDFDGYESAIADLSIRGVIEKTNDIVGTIIVHIPKN